VSKRGWLSKAKMSRRARSVLLSAVLISLSCGPKAVGPPPPAPILTRPIDAVPADLDVVVRIDLGRIRSALGPAVMERLGQGVSVGAGSGDGTAPLLARALEHADTAWLGLRPSDSLEALDSVLVLRGRFEGLDPQSLGTSSAWKGPADLGGGWRRYERRGKLARSAPARLYVHPDDLLVLVTTAEIDGVERALERGARDARLDPPEKGVISLAARSAALAEVMTDRSPAAARLLRKSRTLSASGELSGGRLTVELEVDFEHAEDARSAADAVGLLARALSLTSKRWEQMLNDLHVEAVDAVLVVRVNVDLDVMVRPS
jgi:hypothetical protein